MNRNKTIWFLLAFLLFVAGCGPARHRPIPGVSPILTPPLVPGGVYHTVERGQTFYRIAKTYGVEADELMRVNGFTDPGTLEVGQRLLIPGGVPAPAVSIISGDADRIRSIVGSRQEVYDWRTITVHHSATKQGGARLFDRDHHRRHMGGLFYHFVLGNGTYTEDGEVEIGWRWKKQVKANRPHDIQICLVGDFSKSRVSERQFSSLVTLIRVLQEQYGIPLSGIRRHEDIKGKHTECPGKYFPFHQLLAVLSENDG